MRFITTLIALYLFSFNINAQCKDYIDFPDSNLKTALLNHGSTIISTGLIDLDKDGEICLTEAESYKGTLNISSSNITSLIGIEYFKNVSDFNCANNSISELDLTFLNSSGIAAINCSNNVLTALTLPSELPFFADFECQNNQLASIDVSAFDNLYYINASNNDLTSLNVANGNNYLSVVANNNPNLTCIQIDDNFYPTSWVYDTTIAKLSIDCGVKQATAPLSSYEIKVKDNNAIISWGAEDLSDVSAFTLKKKGADGKWIVVKTIETTTTLRRVVNEYEIIDPINPDDDITYELFQVDNSGNELSFGALPSTKEVAAFPVVLNEYDLNKDSNNNVTISWSTLTEVNNSHFNIQRSLDGEVFETIGEVEGNGNSSTELYYSYTDYEVKEYKGTVYYRLEQVDFDGQSEIFDVLTLVVENNNEFSVYPSPVSVNEVLNITGEKLNSLEMYSLIGEKVLSKSFNSLKEVKINLEGHIPGVYILVINDKSSKKIIIK